MTEGGWVRTKPDYGREIDQVAAVGQDPVEAIVSAGSPRVYFRTGRVVYIDGFECGIQSWYVDDEGGDGTVEWNNVYSFHGIGCAKLKPNSASPWRVYLNHNFPYVLGGLQGVETAVWFGPESHLFMISIYIIRDGTYYLYQLTLDTEVGSLRINNNGVWTNILESIPDLRNSGPAFHILKLVVDPDTGMYELVRFNNRKFDCRAYRSFSAAQNVVDQISVHLSAWDAVGVKQGPIYGDNFIYTVNEEEF